jgi:class 3 adenylate cyclase
MSTNLSPPWLRLPGGARHNITGTCTIGRVPDNTLPLADTEVSRRHAIIHPQGDLECWLVDLGSANGTFLNGRRISQPMPLHHGDLIRLGSHELAFSPRAPASVAAAPTRPLASEPSPSHLAQCWLMVVHISGATQLAQSLPAPELSHQLGARFKNSLQIIHECGGHTSRYFADGFFSHWEDTQDSTIQLRQTVSLMYEAQRAASPPFHIALHFGPAEIGTVPLLKEPRLHGPEIDFVLAMEKIAAAQQQNILFSEAAVTRLSAASEVRLLCESPVEGSTKPAKFYTPSY